LLRIKINKTKRLEMKKSIFQLRFAVVIILIGVILPAITVNTAHADGTVYWDGNDDKNLPCPYGARWNMNPSGGIDSAFIYVNGTSYTMARFGDSAWYADSNQPINVGADVYVEYVGAGGYDYHIELSHCRNGDATPTFTPATSTNTPTSTSTFITPTSTPTNTPSVTPTNTPSVTPTNTPSVTPTNDPGSPTPTNTTTPKNPTPTRTYTQPPQPTVTNIPTQTSIPVLVTATSTPYPPQPAVANDIQTSTYPGESLGAITIGGNAYQLYSGVNASDGSLMLPSNIRGAAFYNNTIWIHRLWRIGFLSINKGNDIVISTAGGNDRTYKVIDSTYIEYGIYPKSNLTDDPYQYIATCYSNNSGEWIGVELYKIKLVDVHPAEHQ
jgi:hypothetical protein